MESLAATGIEHPSTSGADHPESKLQEIITASGISPRLWRLYAYFWLVCLFFPILALTQLHRTSPDVVIAASGLIVFTAIYLAIHRGERHRRYRPSVSQRGHRCFCSDPPHFGSERGNPWEHPLHRLAGSHSPGAARTGTWFGHDWLCPASRSVAGIKSCAGRARSPGRDGRTPANGARSP